MGSFSHVDLVWDDPQVALVLRRLASFSWGGRFVKSTGDGLLATFDGPGRAIGCAVTLRNQLADIDLRIGTGYTLVRSSCAATMSAGSRFTSLPGTSPLLGPAKSSSRGLSATSWRVPR
jgi:hypothetical protein